MNHTFKDLKDGPWRPLSSTKDSKKSQNLPDWKIQRGGAADWQQTISFFAILLTCDQSQSQVNRIAKKLIAIFKQVGLKITIDQSTKTVNFLDVTFNLNDGSYRPYSKPNNVTNYVHKNSNHPQNIIKAIPKSINQRLCSISSDENQFKATTATFQDALNRADYDYNLQFETPQQNQNRRNRKRNVTWYNPPFSKNVATNIGRKFLQLVDKHFPKNSTLHKIFNRNTLKVSYSCMDNMGKIIDAHNKSIMKEKTDSTTTSCNCRKTNDCPLEGKCLTKSVVYKATVTTNRDTKEYIGVSESEFKLRWYNHKSSFKLEHKKKETELSKHIWSLKDNKIDFEIKWSILKHASSYSNNTKRCQLCLWGEILHNNFEEIKNFKQSKRTYK